jgi:hypothetical protein
MPTAIPQELKDLASEIRESHHLKAVDIRPFNGRYEFYWMDYRGNYDYFVEDIVEVGVPRIPTRRDPAAKTKPRKIKESGSNEDTTRKTHRAPSKRGI